MKITASNQPYLLVKSQVLVLFAFEEKPIPPEVIAIDQRLNNLVSTAIKDEKFNAKWQELLLVNIGKGFGFTRLLLVGLGKRRKLPLLNFQRATGIAIKFLQKRKVTQLAIVTPSGKAEQQSLQKVAEAITKGAIIANYQFLEFKTEKSELSDIEELTLLSNKKLKQVEKGIEEGKIIAEAVNQSRDYGNQPSNKATPTHLARVAQKIAETSRVRCRILEKEDMEKLKMGAILGVAQGAKHPPKFIILEYKGKSQSKEWIALVGKGITFDSGGISLKPSEMMELMKFDMAGGGAVIETIEAIAKLKLPLNVVGLVPALENLPSGEAYKPGDVLKSASGKTIEVITTDAEGRIFLADALHYALRYKPKAIIDLATLTGFCIIALGTQAARLFGNNAKLNEKIGRAHV